MIITNTKRTLLFIRLAVYVLLFRPTGIDTTPICNEAMDDESTKCRWILFLVIWMDLWLAQSGSIVCIYDFHAGLYETNSVFRHIFA